MNDVDLFPVPAELLQFLDAPTSTANPEIFRAQTYKKARLGVEAIASRIEYLKVLIYILLFERIGFMNYTLEYIIISCVYNCEFSDCRVTW